MDAGLRLDIAVGLLTRRSHHMVKDPETGRYYPVLAEPLLVQLRLAAVPSSSTGGGVAASGAPIPLSADAHDLMQRIEEEATAQWWYTHPIHRGRGRESLVGKLLAWTTAARGSEVLLLRAGAITARWVEEIQAFFNPQLRRPLPGAACLNKKCGATRVLDREEEGEHFYRPALVQVYDDDGRLDRLECGACGASWSGLELELMGALAK